MRAAMSEAWERMLWLPLIHANLERGALPAFLDVLRHRITRFDQPTQWQADAASTMGRRGGERGGERQGDRTRRARGKPRGGVAGLGLWRAGGQTNRTTRLRARVRAAA